MYIMKNQNDDWIMNFRTGFGSFSVQVCIKNSMTWVEIVYGGWRGAVRRVNIQRMIYSLLLETFRKQCIGFLIRQSFTEAHCHYNPINKDGKMRRLMMNAIASDSILVSHRYHWISIIMQFLLTQLSSAQLQIRIAFFSIARESEMNWIIF